MDKKRANLGALYLVLVCLVWLNPFSFASFDDKDPISATQSNAVPVTDELLNRDGEPGPASPTFKMSDTSSFLVKKPYQLVDKYDLSQPIEESASTLWDDWFFLEEKSQGEPSAEPIDKE